MVKQSATKSKTTGVGVVKPKPKPNPNPSSKVKENSQSAMQRIFDNDFKIAKNKETQERIKQKNKKQREKTNKLHRQFPDYTIIILFYLDWLHDFRKNKINDTTFSFYYFLSKVLKTEEIDRVNNAVTADFKKSSTETED